MQYALITRNQQVLQLLAFLLLAFLFAWFNPFSLPGKANLAISVGLFMILLWVAETLPLAVVALFPLLLHPLLGLAGMEETARAYSNPVIFLFMGGFLLGLAIQKWNLHRRIALSIIQLTGSSGNRIILGFILSTGFLSMWLSNTATTMMMFPISLSVISVMRKSQSDPLAFRNFSLALMLSIAYASNIGGMATIIGTPPNVAFVAYISKRFAFDISFWDWMLVGTPIAILLLLSLYWVLTRALYPNHIEENSTTGQFIRDELHSLGPLTQPEKRVLIIFAGTAFLWMAREPLKQIVPLPFDDNMVAIFGALMLFATPSGKPQPASRNLLLWEDTSSMAWGILLLFGGGIAMANSLEKAGVMTMMGQWLGGFGHLHPFLLLSLIAIVSIFLSELMSNVAQVIVFAPVMAALALALGMDPLLLGIPMTLAASAAGMLPMGTPPNAIVFGSGEVPFRQMVQAGFIMNLISILLISLLAYFLIPLFMKIPAPPF